MKRREFIVGTSALSGAVMFGACSGKRTTAIPGKILGASAAAGHRLRSGNIPPVSEEISADCVVLGGGIAGLAAARRLKKADVSNFLILELEAEVGGNAQSGRNEVSAFPWGAHYLPIPSAESTEVIELLEDLGLIVGRDANGAPIYDEYALCSDPMERLFVNGAWQDGLVPRLDVPAEETKQIDKFFGRMEQFRNQRGSDGRRAFVLPVDRSSRDETFRLLDRITMSQFLLNEGFTSESLRWYVDYCCRDDYGAGIEHISAWAGIHYFASRNARAANAPSNAVLTWPEGNGWLVQRLRKTTEHQIRARSLVCRIEPSDTGVIVDYLDLARERTVRVHAQAAICALPRFVSNHLIQTGALKDRTSAGGEVFSAPPINPRELQYSPWMVANITVRDWPQSADAALSWDNVFRRSRSLGYVNATHQSLTSHPTDTVLTYYQPLDDATPAQAREAALARDQRSWAEQIMQDLALAHPTLVKHVEQLDVWLWGHAMIRPVPGFIWGETRKRMLEPCGRLTFAHSDMSGISVFEEAYTRGVEAADVVLKQIRDIPT